MIGKLCIVLLGLAAITLAEANPGRLSYGGNRRPGVHGAGVVGVHGGRGVVGGVHSGRGVAGGRPIGTGHIGGGVGSGFGVGHGAGVGTGLGGGLGAGLGAGVGAGFGVGNIGAGVGVCAGQSNYDTSLFSDIVIGHPLLDRHPGQGNCNCKFWCLNSRLNKYYCCSRSTYAG